MMKDESIISSLTSSLTSNFASSITFDSMNELLIFGLTQFIMVGKTDTEEENEEKDILDEHDDLREKNEEQGIPLIEKSEFINNNNNKYDIDTQKNQLINNDN